MTGASADIEAPDLTKTYPRDVRALDGLGFTVEAGTVFEIAHLSGAEGLTILLTTHYLEEADRQADLMPAWIQTVARYNPVEWAAGHSDGGPAGRRAIHWRLRPRK
jgi:ABC-type multidrug transport system ATPase subunit